MFSNIDNDADDSDSDYHDELDYSKQLKFYSQVGLVDGGVDPEPPVHIALPNGHICLGYPINYKIEEAEEGIDDDCWLYTYPNINTVSRITNNNDDNDNNTNVQLNQSLVNGVNNSNNNNVNDGNRNGHNRNNNNNVNDSSDRNRIRRRNRRQNRANMNGGVGVSVGGGFNGDIAIPEIKFDSESDILFQISIILTLLLVLDIIFRSIIILDSEVNNTTHLESSNGWVILYYIIMILCDIGCVISVWLLSLRTLGIALAFYITDVLMILLWLDNILQLIEWLIIVTICVLINKYVTLSFGTWHFLMSRARVQELEALH